MLARAIMQDDLSVVPRGYIIQFQNMRFLFTYVVIDRAARAQKLTNLGIHIFFSLGELDEKHARGSYRIPHPHA
jgi:hypothetical protein